jgi:hypothetical protein
MLEFNFYFQEDGFMRWLLLIPICGFLAACAHTYKDVRPGVDGIHRVVVLGDGDGDGERDAIRQANNYCKYDKERNQSAVFMNEDTKYQGSMDEDTNRTVRQASKAAGAVGVGMGVFGGRREQGAGHVAMGAGTVGTIMTHNTYKTEMKFQCK